MKILSMTATFGKLDGETLNFTDGLNVICAPNEWGKSTWCAFLTAMLYGIDTRSRTTRDSIADKEKYQPWSGKPMEGTLRFTHEGKDITIQRRTKGRVPMGDFLAFETHSGIPVPGLTADNCGQLLLGVERSVFQRTGFIRFADLPVDQDEALRRRLNALVTTGDETGSAELLAKKLRELKNRCRYNRTGLIPEVQSEIHALSAQLQERQTLQQQYAQLEATIARTEAELEQLELHRSAMAYYQSQADRRRIEEAAETAKAAQAKLDGLESRCSGIPTRPELLGRLRQGQTLLSQLENTVPQRVPSPLAQILCWLFAILAAAGALLFRNRNLPVYMGISALLALISCICGVVFCVRRRTARDAIARAETDRVQKTDELEDALDQWQEQLALLEDLDHARSNAEQTRLHLQALLSMARDAAPPGAADELTLSREETMTRVAQATDLLRRIRVSLGQCQGRMENLPDAGQLQSRLEFARSRLKKLETTYRALDYAQKALEAAMQELQRRFAPRITRRAGQFLSRLTGGCYDRVSIGSELEIQAAQGSETTLRSPRWRSDGTADQMYLALRLAVWEALTPTAPLILDDALIRFDRKRMENAMELLSALSREHQILLFTCQDREKDWLNGR